MVIRLICVVLEVKRRLVIGEKRQGPLTRGEIQSSVSIWCPQGNETPDESLASGNCCMGTCIAVLCRSYNQVLTTPNSPLIRNALLPI